MLTCQAHARPHIYSLIYPSIYVRNLSIDHYRSICHFIYTKAVRRFKICEFFLLLAIFGSVHRCETLQKRFEFSWVTNNWSTSDVPLPGPTPVGGQCIGCSQIPVAGCSEESKGNLEDSNWSQFVPLWELFEGLLPSQSIAGSFNNTSNQEQRFDLLIWPELMMFLHAQPSLMLPAMPSKRTAFTRRISWSCCLRSTQWRNAAELSASSLDLGPAGCTTAAGVFTAWSPVDPFEVKRSRCWCQAHLIIG